MPAFSPRFADRQWLRREFTRHLPRSKVTNRALKRRALESALRSPGRIVSDANHPRQNGPAPAGPPGDDDRNPRDRADSAYRNTAARTCVPRDNGFLHGESRNALISRRPPTWFPIVCGCHDLHRRAESSWSWKAFWVVEAWGWGRWISRVRLGKKGLARGPKNRSWNKNETNRESTQQSREAGYNRVADSRKLPRASSTRRDQHVEILTIGFGERRASDPNGVSVGCINDASMAARVRAEPAAGNLQSCEGRVVAVRRIWVDGDSANRSLPARVMMLLRCPPIRFDSQ